MFPSESRADIPSTANDLVVQAGWASQDSRPDSVAGARNSVSLGPPPPLFAANDAVENGEDALKSRYERLLAYEGLPSWFISLIAHTLVLILLLLLQFPPRRSSATGVVIHLTDAPTELEADSIALVPKSETIALEETQDSSVAVDGALSSYEPSAIQVESPLPKSDTASDAAPDLTTSLAPVSGAAVMAVQLPKGGVYRRDAASRASLGERYGATPESEDAVEAALRWLAAHQQRDGSWSFDLSQEPCRGQCKNSQSDESLPRPATAATGLALLAFLGAGYNHHEGKYQEEIQRGLYFLREAAAEANAGYDLQGGSMYGHGIAMLAVSEAMAMTRYLGKQDTDLFTLAQRGSQFTANAQHPLGGWRYVPGSPGDMTVTAWQVLSLISAQHGGVVLPTSTLSRAERFIRGLSKPDAYSFGYQSVAAERTTTAVGLCSLMYLGQSPHDEAFAKSLGQVAKRGPKFTDVYHDYYATLALHHARHQAWEKWHVPLREHLIRTQAVKGHEAGSWHFADKNGDVGGRLYTTAMSAMILEVYYRYLPLYQTRDEFKLD
jgi:hypothetical protein